MKPTNEVIKHWIKNYVPNVDMFFIRETDLNLLKDYLNDVLVVPEAEFFKHPSYKHIQIANSYEYWNISKNIDCVIVAHPTWVTGLPINFKKQLFQIQIDVSRGLILPLSYFLNPNEVPSDYILLDKKQTYVIIQHDMWNQLSFENKEAVLKKYALEWDDWNCVEGLEDIPKHLLKYANTFPKIGGSNCLASTLYAILGGYDFVIYEWVHPQTFMQGLKTASFQTIDDELNPGDVVTWVNDEGIILHASYHIGNNYFFNKNGQTFFNPWKVIHRNELDKAWSQYKHIIYRKKVD